MRSLYVVTEDAQACPLGRRERKKQETRSAIKRAALKLALEHGVEYVTVEQISEAADIAPRTFFNYFSYKDEALLGGSDVATAELRELLVSQPAWYSPLRALRSALDESDFVVGAEERREEMLDRHRLITANPSLLPHQLARYSEVERMFTEVMAQRLGVDAAQDLLPALFSSTATGVLRVATERWTVTTDRTLRSLIDEVFDLIEGGALLAAPTDDRTTTDNGTQEVSR